MGVSGQVKVTRAGRGRQDELQGRGRAVRAPGETKGASEQSPLAGPAVAAFVSWGWCKQPE